MNEAIHDALEARGITCNHDGPERSWPCVDMETRMMVDATFRGAIEFKRLREAHPNARVVIILDRAALGEAMTVEVSTSDDHYISMDTDLGHAIERARYAVR